MQLDVVYRRLLKGWSLLLFVINHSGLYEFNIEPKLKSTSARQEIQRTVNSLTMTNSAVFGRKVIALITGASRGIGCEIAIQLAKYIADNSIMLLTARNARMLQEVKQRVECINSKVTVVNVTADMRDDFDKVKLIFASAMDPTFNTVNNFDALLIFHNAGTVGDLEHKALNLCDQQQWSEYLYLNFTVAILLNNFVLQYLSSKIIKQRFVVNITSLLAVKSHPSFTQYSVAKAAREAFFRSLAHEYPEIRVLSYSPGPVLTAMYEEICEKSYDATIREQYISGTKKVCAEGSLVCQGVVSAEQTVTVLLELLNEGHFLNGSRLDYFDLLKKQSSASQ